MTKTIKHTKMQETNKKNPSAKKHPKMAAFKWVTQYKDFFQQKMVPMSENGLERLANDIVNWAINDPKALKISQFILKRGIHIDTYYDWVKLYPIIKDANTIALQAIGDRREIAGLYRKLDGNMISFTMPAYDKTWKELQEWRAKLKEKETNNETKVVVIERYAPIEVKHKDRKSTRLNSSHIPLSRMPSSA